MSNEMNENSKRPPTTKLIAFMFVVVMIFSAFTMLNFGTQAAFAPSPTLEDQSFIHPMTIYYHAYFIESGLPSGTNWNVTYDGVVYSSTTTTIETSMTTSGTYSYTIPNAGSGIYDYPVYPSSGTLSNTGTLDVAFGANISASATTTDIGIKLWFHSTSAVSGLASTYTVDLWVGSTNVATATANTSSTVSASYTFSSSGSYNVYLIWSNSNPSEFLTPTITETINALPSVTISSNINPSDAGQSVTFSSSVSGGTSPYTYEWFLNGSAVSGATSSTWVTTTLPIGSPTIYVKATDSSSYTAQSNTVTETVNPPLTVSISSSKNPSDYGQSVTFNSVVQGGTQPYTYQWSMNGANVSGATSSAWTTTTLPVGNDAIKLWVTDAAGDPRPGHPNASVPNIRMNLAAGFQTTDQVYIDNEFNLSVVGVGSFNLIGNQSLFNNFIYQWFLNGTKIVGATNWYYDTWESHPATYDFSVTIIPVGTQYHGQWLGRFYVLVTANFPPNSLDIVESGLPVGSSWSAAIIVYAENSSYPYGTTFTQPESHGYQTVYGNTSVFRITPPNGTWTYYIDQFSTGPPGYAKGFYAPNISSGTVTLPADTSNGSIIIRITFTPIGTLSNNPSNWTSTTLLNAALNAAFMNSTLKNSIPNTTILPIARQNSSITPVITKTIPRQISRPAFSVVSFIFVSLAAICLILSALGIQRFKRKKQRYRGGQD